MSKFVIIKVPKEIADEAISMFNKYNKRFNNRYLIDNTTGCWNWIGGTKTSDGYGKFWCLNESYGAHRVSLWLKGLITLRTNNDWLEVVDHLCKNKSCVNPEHLEIVTAKENIRRNYK